MVEMKVLVNQLKQTMFMKKNAYLLAGLCAICLSASAQQTNPLPSAEAVGLTHIVPDMLLWFHTNDYFTNGPIIGKVADTNSTIWDCYLSALGDSTFVITSVTYATNNSPLPPFPGSAANGWECFALAFQPAAGGAPKLGYAFYDDYGRPYLKRISARQTGNPGRVAADKRYGAVNFVTGAQGNVGYTGYTDTNFQSNARWTTPYNQTGQRYAFEQIFSVQPGDAGPNAPYLGVRLPATRNDLSPAEYHLRRPAGLGQWQLRPHL